MKEIEKSSEKSIQKNKWYCIYRITNIINGKTYIGQHRYTNEANPMGSYKGSGKLLKLAYKKYGKENFETEVLYKRIRDKATVDAMEIWAIEKYKPEYNIAKGGTGGDIVSYLSPEAYNSYKQKLSENSYFRGKRFVPREYMTEEEFDKYRQKISESNRKVEHTAEWNAKVAKSTKAFYQNGNHGSNYGVKFSESHCKCISESRKGYKWFNNGVEEVQAKECPEGYVPGFKPGHFKNRVPWNKGKKGVQVPWNKGLHKEKGDEE